MHGERMLDMLASIWKVQSANKSNAGTSLRGRIDTSRAIVA